MAKYNSFAHALETVTSLHPEYDAEAYHLLDRTMNFASSVLELEGHLTAQQLHLCYCKLAEEEYGVLASELLAHWGLETPSDLGQIVYNLIEVGVLGKNNDDDQADFDHLPDFNDVIDMLITHKLSDISIQKPHFFYLQS